MLQRGNTGDVSQFINGLGFKRKSLKEALLERPAQESDQWHARLYFLKPILRFAIAFLWVYTGIISAFIYPESNSISLLERVGISHSIAPLALYGAAILDFGLGLATLFRYRIAAVGLIQIALIIIYTIFISFGIPEFWVHPFGPITKNIPLIMAILIMISLEKK